MRAAILHGPESVSLEQVPDPAVVVPTDAVVRVIASCICGSDLWHYRGSTKRPSGRIGHEFVGVVEDVGTEVAAVQPGQLVVAPFVWSCGVCANCRAGWTTSCLIGGDWGADDRDGHPVDGGQGEFVRVPLADGTLFPAEMAEDDPRVPAVLALTDVMGTGHHAALSAGAAPGETVAVIGDGAVGLCAVLAAARLGAERIIMLSTHPDRAAMADTFGATDIVAARGDDAVAAVRDLTNGLGADGACECVGNTASWDTALRAVRPGGTVGYVGVPHGVKDGLPLFKMFGHNVNVRGGVAPVRTYIPDLLADVLAGNLDPSPIFTRTLPLADVAQGYLEMDSRTEIKVMLRP